METFVGNCIFYSRYILYLNTKKIYSTFKKWPHVVQHEIHD